MKVAKIIILENERIWMRLKIAAETIMCSKVGVFLLFYPTNREHLLHSE